MSFVLGFGLILMTIVPTSQGINWIGTFENKGTCNMTGCCCPQNSLVLQNTTGIVTATISTNGKDCHPQYILNVTDISQDTLQIGGVGSFKLTNGDANLEVLLEQASNGEQDVCKVNMTRITSSGTGGGGKPSGGGSAGSSTSASEPSLNHGSILIKFISIIMTTTVIVYI